MSLTPETLPRHELVGLHVRVVDATHPGYVGIGGRVVRETAATLFVEGPRERGPAGASRSDASGDAESRVRQVPKRGATFEFALTDEAADGTFPPAEGARKGSGTASKPRDGAAGSRTARAGRGPATGHGDGAAHVTVDGTRLEARPAERSELTGDSKWR